VSAETADRPAYHQSQKLDKMKKFICKAADEKPRQLAWVTRQLDGYDLYSERARLKDNIEKILEDPRTPVEKRDERVVNTLSDYDG